MENNAGIKNFFKSPLGKVILTATFIVLIYGGILLCLSFNQPLIALPIALAMTVFGWKKLGPTNPFLKIFASGNFLIFYYIFKLMLAVFIGYIVAPFQLSRMIVKHIESKE